MKIIVLIDVILIISMIIQVNSNTNINPSTGIEWLEKHLIRLETECLEYMTNGWWRYKWCHKREVLQFHLETSSVGEKKIISELSTGKYKGKVQFGHLRSNSRGSGPPDFVSYYYQQGDSCTKSPKKRSTEVRIVCCKDSAMLNNALDKDAWIINVIEVSQCSYLVNVCAKALCDIVNNWHEFKVAVASNDTATLEKLTAVPNKTNAGISLTDSKTSDQLADVTENERERLKEQVREMFYHGYENYMQRAFPLDELRPLTCSGDDFEPTAGNMLTLLDNLDFLVILGNYSEFARVVRIIEQTLVFDLDSTVSVFETSIRILGGLVSGHILASDKERNIMPSYTGGLLKLAIDLGDRLMPAFNTTTSIPYGTVNLRRGVPKHETTVACTAAAGSLSLEFGMLSILSGDPKYGVAARKALVAIYNARSSLGLVGRHIDVNTGIWTEPVAGIGLNIDSLYEYYLKHYILFGDEDAYDMFVDLYSAAISHLRVENALYVEVDMFVGTVQRRNLAALQAFWPGMQTLVGDFPSATNTINAFLRVWDEFGFLPEEFSIDRWSPLSGGRRGYYLRPELAESVYYFGIATKDPSWFLAARNMIDNVLAVAQVRCGFANIRDIKTKSLEDKMPSFFLSEFLKYFYLLFDVNNFARDGNGGNFIFTTEAHLFPVRMEYQNMAREYKFAFPSSRKNKPNHKWGVPSLTPEMINGYQCPAIPSSDLESSVYYGSQPGKRVTRNAAYEFDTHGAGQRTVVHMHDDEIENMDSATTELFVRSSDLEDETLYKVTYSPLSVVVERQDNTQSAVEITNLGARVTTIRMRGGTNMVFLDTETPDFSFRVVGTAKSQLAKPACVTPTDDRNSCPADASSITQELTMNMAVSEFGPYPFTKRSVNATLVMATSSLGCSKDAYPPALVRNKLVLVNRGDCMFEEKAKYAQAGGAVGIVVIQNKEDEPIFFMAKTGFSSWLPFFSSKIPAFMVSKTEGAALTKLMEKGQEVHMDIEVDRVKNTDGVYPWAAMYDKKLTIVASQEWGLRLLKQSARWSLIIFRPNFNTNSEAATLKTEN